MRRPTSLSFRSALWSTLPCLSTSELVGHRWTEYREGGQPVSASALERGLSLYSQTLVGRGLYTVPTPGFISLQKCSLGVGIIFFCCLCCFLACDPIPPTPRLLQDLFPKAAELYERVASNREHWTKVSHKFTIRGLPSNNSLDFLDEEYEVPDLDGTRAPVNGCCSLEG